METGSRKKRSSTATKIEGKTGAALEDSRPRGHCPIRGPVEAPARSKLPVQGELRLCAASGRGSKAAISAAVRKMEQANARTFFRVPQGGGCRPPIPREADDGGLVPSSAGDRKGGAKRRSPLRQRIDLGTDCGLSRAPAPTARNDALARDGGRFVKRPYGDGRNVLASPTGGGVARRLTQAG